MTDQSWVIARPSGELRVRLDEGWTWDEATVRAAPSLQTGRDEPPVNTWDLPARIEENVLVVPVELSSSRWVLRIDVEASNRDKAYRGDMYFVVDVQP